MAWFLYVIECRDGSLYTGIALDPAARYALHVSGKGARYTRSHPPARLVFTEPHPDRSSALKAEHAFKKLSAARKREKLVIPAPDNGIRGQAAAGIQPEASGVHGFPPPD